MTAENGTDKLAAGLLDAASKGEALAAAFVSFASQFRTPPTFHLNSFTAFASMVSFTAIHLRDLNETLTKYGNIAQFDESVLAAIPGAVVENFEKVDTELKKAIESHRESGDDRIVWLQGPHGRTILKGLYAGEAEDGTIIGPSLEDAEKGVWCLASIAKFLALRKLDKEDGLEADQKKDLGKLCRQVGDVVDGVRQVHVWLGRYVQGIRDAEDNVKEIQIDRSVEYISDERPFEIIPGVRRIDDDVRSIASFDSCASNQFLGIAELYEVWKLSGNDGSHLDSNRSWSFLGLTVKEHYNNATWSVDPLIRTDEEMKAASETVLTGLLTQEQTDYIERILATLPGRAREEVRYLLLDRERVSSNSRYSRKWTIVDIKAVTAKNPVHAGWIASWWNRQPATQEWELMIKGETLDRSRAKVPDRYQDPFKKSVPRGRELDIRVQRNRQRYYSPPPRPRPRVWSHDRAIRRVDSQPFTRVLTPDEAEKGMGELLAGLVSVVKGSAKVEADAYEMVED